jgi:HSP20 family protein
MYPYRYTPMRLADAMSRLFDESVIMPQAGSATLPMDVLANGDAYVITAAVPGLKAEDLALEVLGDTVVLRGEIAAPEAVEGNSWLLRERRFGKFERTLTLPTELNGTGAEAAIENGVLTVRIPKAEAHKRKAIKVTSK